MNAIRLSLVGRWGLVWSASWSLVAENKLLKGDAAP
jgi:hypothetical protein